MAKIHKAHGDNGEREKMMMAFGRKPKTGDSTMPGWEGSRGGYRRSGPERNGRHEYMTGRVRGQR
jgi:hypothetical protein